MDTRKRRPAGVPTGGQFAPEVHAEADIELDGPDEQPEDWDDWDTDWERSQRLITQIDSEVDRLLDIAERHRNGQLADQFGDRVDELQDGGLDRASARAATEAEFGHGPAGTVNGVPADVLAEQLVVQAGQLVHTEALARCGPPPPCATAEEIAAAAARRDAIAADEGYGPAWKEASAEVVAMMFPDHERVWRDAYAASCREVLAEVRDFGGDHPLHPGSQKAAAKRIAEALDHYPADWVANSASHELALHVRYSKARAHYQHRAIVHSHETRQRESTRSAFRYSSREGYEAQLEFWQGATHGDPQGRRSSQRILEVTGNPDTTTISFVHEGGRYRARTGTHSASELTDDATMSTAIHETAHRMEHTNPRVLLVESAFYRRRTSVEGHQEASTAYHGRASEQVRADGFVDEYVGKDYQGRAYEVLSVGMESVFAGRHGALAGVEHPTSDPDHAAFVLGTLAVV